MRVRSHHPSNHYRMPHAPISPRSRHALLALVLACVAGYTNVFTLLACGHVTSHVSGTLSQFGHDAVEGRWSPAWFAAWLLAAFMGGAMFSSLCAETARRRRWPSRYVLPLGMEALLLLASAVAALAGGSALAAGLAAAAMGLQNAAITELSGGVVRTTHMTGIATDLGLESVRLAMRHDQPEDVPDRVIPVHPRRPSPERLALLSGLLASFTAGAALAAEASNLAGNESPVPWLFPPVVLVACLIADIWKPFAPAREVNVERK